MTIKITPIPALRDNYIWAIINLSQHTALLIDPGEARPAIHFLEHQQLKPTAILITHHHWDHTNGIKELYERYSIPVYGPQNTISEITHRVKDNEQIQIDAMPSLQVLAIPGHTLDHIAYYHPGIIFCGDTLFAAGCGRLFEGKPEQLFSSLQKIANLPDTTKIYSAHEYTLSNLHFADTVEPHNEHIAERIQEVNHLRDQHLPSLPSTLADEKATNPFLRCHSSKIKNNVEHFAGKTLSTPLEVFTWLRKWKDQF